MRIASLSLLLLVVSSSVSAAQTKNQVREAFKKINRFYSYYAHYAPASPRKVPDFCTLQINYADAAPHRTYIDLKRVAKKGFRVLSSDKHTLVRVTCTEGKCVRTTLDGKKMTHQNAWQRKLLVKQASGRQAIHHAEAFNLQVALCHRLGRKAVLKRGGRKVRRRTSRTP